MKQPSPRVMAVAAAVCLTALIAMAVCLGLRARPAKFVPPPFDPAAVAGEPNVPEGLGWSEVYQTGMSFRASVCGLFRAENGAADVYLYSDPVNQVWLKLRVLNEQGDILGETGLIKPGEYVQSVALTVLPTEGEEITLKIMSYQPETYYSQGSISVLTKQ